MREFKDWTHEELSVFIMGAAYADSTLEQVLDILVGKGMLDLKTHQLVMDATGFTKQGLRMLCQERGYDIEENLEAILRIGSDAKRRISALGQATEEAKEAEKH